MHAPKKLSDEMFLEMRWRCLSLAADLDRADRQGVSDARLQQLRDAFGILLDGKPDRAQRVQMLFSDQSREIVG
jgi:hypothetical protein